MKATFYTVIALIAFAANSLLCRMALAASDIDAWSFTIIRLSSAAIGLAIIMAIHSYILRQQVLTLDTTAYNEVINGQFHNKLNDKLNEKGSWLSSACLVIYALCFSIAYVELDTGTGALILFSAVQLTMIGWGIYQKEPLSALQWLAFIIAVAGFVYLMLPSTAVPSLLAAVLMAISGMAWGIYSIRGKSCMSPLQATGFNFIRSLVAIPILSVIGLFYLDNIGLTNIDLSSITIKGIWLACTSGIVASGMGYSVWYMAMPLLKTTQAAIVQLCVPVLAAILGIIFLSEPLTLPFVVASSVILGAVLIFILNKKPIKT